MTQAQAPGMGADTPPRVPTSSCGYRLHRKRDRRRLTYRPLGLHTSVTLAKRAAGACAADCDILPRYHLEFPCSAGSDKAREVLQSAAGM